MLVTAKTARAAKLQASGKQLAEQVDALRDTISTIENGKRITYAFDVGLSHEIYKELFAPFGSQLAGITHLVFEPDGAMLRLPPNLLVMDQASVDAYKQRAAAGGDAEYRLPRNSLVRSRSRHQHIGLTTRICTTAERAALVRTEGLSRPWREYPTGIVDCRRWCRRPPIGIASCRCLPGPSPSRRGSSRPQRNIVSTFDPNGVQIITRDGFTDTGLEARGDLNQYRIVHFATHGVVTARAPKCAAQPALADQLRRRRVRRAADLPGDLRPAARRRSRDPLGLRHGGQGERGSHPAGRPCNRRRCRARTAWCVPLSAPAAASSLQATGRCPTTSTRPSA